MSPFFEGSLYFGLFITILAYVIGVRLYGKFPYAIFTPLLVADFIVVAALLLFRVEYADYHRSARFLEMLLTPATICLAIPLYKQLDILKKNFRAIFIGIAAGVFANSVGVLILSRFFGFSHELYVTLFPKSVTSPIGIGLSEELGGIVTLTVASIIVSGMFGNVTAEPIYRLFRVTDPVARGIGLGTASHAMGAAKAFQLGEIEGAMSGLAIVITGLFTVAVAPFFVNLL
ncbi:LrgB family protein [Synergistaceae bacterium OttesenSCG-928-D05]|nr:LrgB family protein [Synergistaceae bacterium OttesenSCG-928-D05]